MSIKSEIEEEEELGVCNPEPCLNQIIPISMVRNETVHSHHSSVELSHPSINNFIHCDNSIQKILDIQLEIENVDDLNEFCNNVIHKKFREAIKNNIILPWESDKKNFDFKVYGNRDINDIKTKIFDTINNPDPKIRKFIDSTIDTLMITNMKLMDRSFISLHEQTFHKIVFTSKLYKRFIRSNYHKISITLVSIDYV